jgi:hypothetical protein
LIAGAAQRHDPDAAVTLVEIEKTAGLRWFPGNILPSLVDCKNRSMVRKQGFLL